MDVYNKNIIHPMPYLLYVLKVGFEDAGFQLYGDILEDTSLLQRCIFSGKDYFTTADQKAHSIKVFATEYNDHGSAIGKAFYLRNNNERRVSVAKFLKSVKISAPGKYRIKVKVFTYQDIQNERRIFPNSSLRIFRNKTELKSYISGEKLEIKDDSLTIDISEEEALAGTDLIFEYNGIVAPDITDTDGKNLGVAQLDINPIRQHTEDGAVIPYVFNENKINLKRAMPDMSFGELVTIIKNLRNYDLEFDGNKAIMNTIKLVNSGQGNLQDFRNFEIKNPLRKFTEKSYFNLKFPEADSVEIKNIFIDEKGYELNKATIPSNTTEISINVICLKPTNFRGQYTAKAEDESALMLVHYAGLDNEGNNHATNPEGLEGDVLARHLLPWYQNRLTNFSYKWTFITEKNKIRNFNIRSEIFCYGKRHLIKSWTKKSLNERLYSIEIETETY